MPLRLSGLADACAYENGVMRVAKTTYRDKYIPTQRSLVRFFGDVAVDGLAPADIARWQSHLEERDITVTSANSYKSVARAMFRRLDRSELAQVLVDRDPGPPASKAMSDEHLERILRAANIRDAAIVLLLAHSGRRRATICRLHVAHTKIWQGPDGDFRLASKSVEKGKRTVLVFAKQRAALATMLWMESRPDPDSPYVFTHLESGEALSPDGVTGIFRKLRQRANISKVVQISPHALRHRFAQHQLEQFDARVVADWMGITVETVLQVYATRSEDMLERLFFEE